MPFTSCRPRRSRSSMAGLLYPDSAGGLLLGALIAALAYMLTGRFRRIVRIPVCQA